PHIANMSELSIKDKADEIWALKARCRTFQVVCCSPHYVNKHPNHTKHAPNAQRDTVLRIFAVGYHRNKALEDNLKWPHKKVKDEEKEKDRKPEKGLCFWDSVTTTMRQISPAKKLEKIEGWEPPPMESDGVVPSLESVDLDLDSWAGRGLEEDNSRYANLSDSKDAVGAVRWTARAKVRLAGIGRMGRGIVSESVWEGLK
uniref:Uncharacterized protein n=1 Tax=Neogobius melanostomus TaxID=47308 RepID=A0A8C6WJM3_9GOBI